MYEYLIGTITEAGPAYAVSETNGMGYLLNISLQTYGSIETGKVQKLYLHQVIRDDARLLFGFADTSERELFRLLISVSGVGANTARIILSSLEAGELKTAIESEDVNTLKSVKGIGAKTAQRIIVDLKDKIAKAEIETGSSGVAASGNNKNEALSALIMLGFPKKNARKALNIVTKQNPQSEIEELVKQALKRL